jgi:hypothetical protein
MLSFLFDKVSTINATSLAGALMEKASLVRAVWAVHEDESVFLFLIGFHSDC